MSKQTLVKDMIKKTFTITPESGSNNNSISINAKFNTDINAVQETIAKKQLSKASVVSLASNGEMINELKSGQIQAVVLEKAIAEGYIAQNDDLTLASFNLKSDGSDAYAVAIRKGSDDLLKEINAVIKETKESGKFDQWLKEASSYKQSK